MPESFDSQLLVRANALVNPRSGLANDYLNSFNEISMLVENYPAMPEFGPEILSWHSVAYEDYFLSSNLPGRDVALRAWRATNKQLREAFENLIVEMDQLAFSAKVQVKNFEAAKIDAEMLEQYCGHVAGQMKNVLLQATHIVNNGTVLPTDDAQERVDRIMLKRGGNGRRRTDRA